MTTTQPFRSTRLPLGSLLLSLLLGSLAGCVPQGVQRYRDPAPAQDVGATETEALLGTCAGLDDGARQLHVVEWAAKRTWYILGLGYERKDYQGPPELGGVTKTDDHTEISGVIANGGVPVRNQRITCEVKQSDQEILMHLRGTDAFGEVLIGLDLVGGNAWARSVTVSRSLIGGQSHSSPMPEQASHRLIGEYTFMPLGKGWHRLRIETLGARITFATAERDVDPAGEWTELFAFDDPDPAGGKYGFGSVGTVAVREINQWELIPPGEKTRREACLKEMHAFCKSIDADYDTDVRTANRMEAEAGRFLWTWPPTGATAEVKTTEDSNVTAVVRSGLYGDDVLIDGAFPRVEVVAEDDRVFRRAGETEIQADEAGLKISQQLFDDAGNQATAHIEVKFTVLPVWWWTVTIEGVEAKHIQAFLGVAPEFLPKVDANDKATKVPNIADSSIEKYGKMFRHNGRTGLFLKTIMPNTTLGVNAAGNSEAVFSTTDDKLRFASLWLPAQPLNRTGFTSRMVHYIRYGEGPIQHWRRQPSYQEYPSNVDLARFAGNGCDAMVWHHTWLGQDYRDREGMFVNHKEMKRAADETHRLGMGYIGYIGIVPGRSSLLRYHDCLDQYAKNWDLQDFTFYSVAGRWGEFLPWMTDYWCREYGLDGYYADGALGVARWGRLDGPLHPEDADLSLDEMIHRLYYRVTKILARHGARFGLQQWGSSADTLLAGFYDARMIGESFQEAKPDDYERAYNALITGTPFKMYGMRASSQNPYNIAMAAINISDIQVCSGNGAWGDDPDDAETWARVRPLWDLLSSIDFDSMIEARPWYAQELVEGNGLYAAHYTEPERVLIFLANRTEDPGLFEVRIDTSRLPKIDGYWEARYVLGREGDLGRLGTGKFGIQLPALHDGPIGIELIAR